MNLSQVVSRDEWLAARKELLAKEKKATRVRNALRTARQALPMVENIGWSRGIWTISQRFSKLLEAAMRGL